jgi:hypothetical protein
MRLTRKATPALHVASFNSRIKVVDLLLNHGAKAGVPNSLGFSPLHQAVRRFWEVPGETEAGRAENQRQIVLLLLAHDADPELEDLSHRTAAVLATESNNAALAALFDLRSMGSGQQATAPPPAASRPPLQESSIDTPPQNEPEGRQYVEGAPAPENPREAESTKTERAVAGSEPKPPSEPTTAIIPPPITKPMETLQSSEPSDPSMTAAGSTEAPIDSTAKVLEPPTSTSTEPAPAERMSSELHQTPGLPTQTPGTPRQARPPISPAPPAHRSEAEIPHTKAVPDLPQQKSTRAPQAPHTLDQPSPGLQKSDPPYTLPSAPQGSERIGALAQPATPRDPILESGQDRRPSPRGPATGYPVKEPKESSVNWMFRNLGFGLGIGWTHNLGPQRIESATAVNGLVRVDAEKRPRSVYAGSAPLDGSMG